MRAEHVALLAEFGLLREPRASARTLPAKRPRAGLKPPRLRLLGRRGRLRIYLVDATAVRKMTHILPEAPDFTMGTGDQVWRKLTGPNEIWISDELKPLERKLTWLHEATERRLMKTRGLTYDEAHEEALKVEDYYRQRDGRGLAAALRKEQGQ